jgi:hypothetical protein
LRRSDGIASGTWAKNALPVEVARPGNGWIVGCIINAPGSVSFCQQFCQHEVASHVF